MAKEPEETVIKDKKPEIESSEYEARTKLDVSNPLYINPSLDHYKKK